MTDDEEEPAEPDAKAIKKRRLPRPTKCPLCRSLHRGKYRACNEYVTKKRKEDYLGGPR